VSSSDAVPTTVPFVTKTTVPVGTLFGDPDTVAVSATSLPSAAGDGDATTVVDVALGLAPGICTVCANAADTLGGTPALPLNRAVIACPATASDDVVNDAVVPTTGALPSSVAPS